MTKIDGERDFGKKSDFIYGVDASTLPKSDARRHIFMQSVKLLVFNITFLTSAVKMIHSKTKQLSQKNLKLGVKFTNRNKIWGLV